MAEETEVYFRALRVMRVSLLAGELKQMNVSSSGALLSGAASVRLFQLVASVLTLLFTTSSIVSHHRLSLALLKGSIQGGVCLLDGRKCVPKSFCKY